MDEMVPQLGKMRSTEVPHWARQLVNRLCRQHTSADAKRRTPGAQRSKDGRLDPGKEQCLLGIVVRRSNNTTLVRRVRP